MKIIREKILNAGDKEVVFNLWNIEYPVNLSFATMAEMDSYLNTLSDLTFYLLKNETNQIEGWAMTFGREQEKWFAITISHEVQGQGKGRYLLDKLKSENDILNGWVIDHENYYKNDGQKYKSPLLFYKKNDFQIFPEYRLDIPILSAIKISWYKNKNTGGPKFE